MSRLVTGWVRGLPVMWGLVPRGVYAVRSAVSRLRREAFFASCERAVRAVAVRIRYGPRLARAWLTRSLKGLRRNARAGGRSEAGSPAVVPYGRPESLSRFMDYGPDWPPLPRRRRVRHPLLRRCLAVVVLYAVIWALGAVLLELRLYQLGGGDGAPVTTYTTVSPPR